MTLDASNSNENEMLLLMNQPDLQKVTTTLVFVAKMFYQYIFIDSGICCKSRIFDLII